MRPSRPKVTQLANGRWLTPREPGSENEESLSFPGAPQWKLFSELSVLASPLSSRPLFSLAAHFLFHRLQVLLPEKNRAEAEINAHAHQFPACEPHRLLPMF